MLRFAVDAWMNGTADVSARLQSQKQVNVRILQQSVKYYMFADVNLKITKLKHWLIIA